MPAVGGAAVHKPLHEAVQPRHIERAVLHPDVDVVGPRFRHPLSGFVGELVPGMAADVVDRLAGLEQLYHTIDPFRHLSPLSLHSSGVGQTACLLANISP